jgi:hypothetical protein
VTKGISATTIKSWFQYSCERKTRYEMLGPEELAAIPVTKDIREHAWSGLGADFEAGIVASLGKDAALPAPGERTISERVALSFLRGERLERYVHQIDLKPRTRPALLSRVPDVEIRRTFADLVRVDRNGPVPSFTVIDIKAARRATGFHKAQVAFYVRLLEARLRELGLPASLDDSGEIWRMPDSDASTARYEAERFALAPYLRMVDAFCNDDLPGISGKRVEPGVDETFFHLYFKCEQCDYLEHCLGAIAPDRPANLKDVSAVAGISHEGKRGLHRLGIRTVASLAAARGLAQQPGIGWSLQRRASTLVLRAQALSAQRILRTEEAHSFLMPGRVDVAIYIAADYDPIDDNLVTLGSLVVHGAVEQFAIEVIQTAGRQAEADALARVFAVVLGALNIVDQYNQLRGPADPSALHAHLFIYEPAEARAIQAAIERNLGDPRIRTGLLNMVRLFPPEGLVPEPEFRGMQHLPATALRSVVEQLYALPTSVSYDLRQVSCALRDAELVGTAYDPVPPFARPFSALLPMQVARDLRGDGRAAEAGPADVRVNLKTRLTASRAVAEWLLGEHRNQLASGGPPLLRLRKMPFRFQATFNPLAPGDLDVLQALELIENRAGLLARLVALARPADRRRDQGGAMTALRLESHRPEGGIARLRFSVPPESRDADLGPESFGLILTDDDPEILLDPAAWPDVACRILPGPPGRPRQNGISVQMSRAAYQSQTFQTMLRRAGERAWCIDQSFADPNTPRIAAFLRYLAVDPGP